MRHKTIVISDVHLGTKHSKVKELIQFLKENPCDRLIMNGDIVDAWHIKQGGKWKKKDTKFFRTILDLTIKNKTEIIYVKGNHDDFISEIAPFHMDRFKIVEDYILDSNGRKFIVVHGDIFDNITSKIVWLSKIGSIGYNLLLYINKIYNKKRMKEGNGYKSISQVIKDKVKYVVKVMSDFENRIYKFAELNECDGIICGHIHRPSIEERDGIVYMNSGDWVESMSALIEGFGGDWSVYKFDYLVNRQFEQLSLDEL